MTDVLTGTAHRAAHTKALAAAYSTGSRDALAGRPISLHIEDATTDIAEAYKQGYRETLGGAKK